MFGRKRQNAELALGIRLQLASVTSEALAQLAAAMTQMETRLSVELEQRARLHQTCTEIAIESVQQSVTSHTTDVAAALSRVADMYGILSEQLEADRLERRELSEKILQLTQPKTLSWDVPARTIGGTIFASPELLPPDEISLLDDDEDRTADDVSAAADRWWGDDNPWKRPPPTFPGMFTDEPIEDDSVREPRQSSRG